MSAYQEPSRAIFAQSDLRHFLGSPVNLFLLYFRVVIVIPFIAEKTNGTFHLLYIQTQQKILVFEKQLNESVKDKRISSEYQVSPNTPNEGKYAAGSLACGIDGGAVWREKIARGITNCSLVLSIVCHGYSKSEWCLKELALAKLLRKPLVGLIVEEDHPAAMASLEPLLPSRHAFDLTISLRPSGMKSARPVVFEIDDAAFAQRWQGIRPRLMSIHQDGTANVLIPERAPTSKRNKLSSLTIESEKLLQHRHNKSQH
ncbi:hypothetical protein PsorP6_005355 [Peronosclerospora sorghi]|uniref:Uncharacterized protein n=1 Tax=Peronosclerospora sorghi TaxID=230839 RepID=A0ACC0W1P7_9STRA|nr:hypothetical protein PsorP6_005355 [Peronosclerospora sorghi]